MRKTTTSRDAAVGSDALYEHESGNLEKRHRQPLSRESSVAWSLHDANVSCAADRLSSQKYKLPWETGFAWYGPQQQISQVDAQCGRRTDASR